VSDAKKDRILGMNRTIPRRDFLNGAAVTIGASLAAPGNLWSEVFGLTDAASHAFSPERDSSYYPPARTGLRGSHDGSWEVAHAMRDGKRWDHPAIDPDEYDLVIVGAGISGLSAAYFYRKHAGAKSRVLILDNHDDFGGHAKRNEFQAAGRLLIGYGGTQSIASPNLYSAEARELFRELGIETKKFEQYFDQDFYSSRDMSRGVFFDKETFGADRTVARLGEPSWTEFLAKTPLSTAAQKDIARLFTERVDYLPTLNSAQKKAYLAKTSYKQFLLKDAKVSPDVIPFFQTSTYGLYGVGIDAVPAGDLAGLRFWPGFAGMDLAGPPGPGIGLEVTRQDAEPYIYHFPDGNASIARLLVRSLIPGSAPGHTMEDIVLARMDYAKLDDAASPVRIRLNSTVVHVANQGDAAASKGAAITYVRGGEARLVHAKSCIMACWNMVIPYICPELPAKQKEALAYNVKVPLVYATIQLRNRAAFEKLKAHPVDCPGSFFSEVALDFPVSLDGYAFPKNSQDSCLVHMQHVPCEPGYSAREQQRIGRGKLLATTFEMFERNIREQLNGMLGSGGFDAARDIEAITVNRWPHGYAYEYNSLFDPIWPPGEAPHEIGRKPFGRLHIANSDAGAFAYTNEAIDQGYRAVQEVIAKKS
jgi:spermidine dehydrogenase